jgi:hypothetical protein
MRNAGIVLTAFVTLGGSVFAGAEDQLFPFVISYDAPNNVTNVSAWIERPAGRHGLVRNRDGHLATDAGPIRFWGTNLAMEACFPMHEPTERVAARLARLGINCVRMHFMDEYAIWCNSPKGRMLDPQKLERFDYLVYQLKLHGVYTNLNLHVGRWFDDWAGFPSHQLRPMYDKGVDTFEPRMIELQKDYARDLLTHVNPYTKTAYADEPCVAFVEISNEDSLLGAWQWGQLDRLAEPFATTLRTRWNAWFSRLGRGAGGEGSLREDSEKFVAPANANRYVSDTSEICWDVSQKDAGYFTVNTRRTKLFTGFGRDRTFPLGDVILKIGPTRLDWATVSMTVVEGEGFDRPGRILVAATGWVQNQDARLEHLGDRRITLGNRWGNEPVLCEGIRATITLPVAAERVKCYPLDESGNRRAAIAVGQAGNKAQVELAPQHKTVWYELEIGCTLN